MPPLLETVTVLGDLDHLQQLAMTACIRLAQWELKPGDFLVAKADLPRSQTPVP